MDEVLRRRLVGAGVLLAGAFVLSSLLPDAGPRAGRALDHVVTYDLRTGQPIDLPEVAKPVAPSPAKPAIATAPAATTVEPAISTTPTTPMEAKPVESKAVPSKPVELKLAESKAAAPKPVPPKAVAAPSTVSHPVLKVDESFGAKLPATKPAASGEWFVQIGSFESQANASATLKKLYGAGLPALIQTVPTGKKLWYRVRVGPFATENAATKALGTARAQGYKQARLVKPDNGPVASGN